MRINGFIINSNNEVLDDDITPGLVVLAVFLLLALFCGYFFVIIYLLFKCPVVGTINLILHLAHLIHL